MKKTISLLTAIVFLLNQVLLPAQGWAEVSSLKNSEVTVHQPGFRIDIPPELGSVDALTSGNGPAIVHIQEAHGSRQMQEQIDSVLQYLNDKYGFDLIFLEGSSFELDPSLLDFFPSHPEVNQAISENLEQVGLLTGPELFLMREKGAKGYGVENLESYVANGAAFKAVLRLSKNHLLFADPPSQSKSSRIPPTSGRNSKSVSHHSHSPSRWYY